MLELPKATLAHLELNNSKKVETLEVLFNSVPQGSKRQDWLVSLETADSHGVSGLITALKG